MTGFKIKHNNITQQCNFDVQLASSALNQLRKHCLLARRHLEAFWCFEGDLKIVQWLSKGELWGTAGNSAQGLPPVLGADS